MTTNEIDTRYMALGRILAERRESNHVRRLAAETRRAHNLMASTKAALDARLRYEELADLLAIARAPLYARYARIRRRWDRESARAGAVIPATVI